MLQLHIDKEAAVALRLYRNASAVDDGRAAGRPAGAVQPDWFEPDAVYILKNVQYSSGRVVRYLYNPYAYEAYERVYTFIRQGVPTIND